MKFFIGDTHFNHVGIIEYDTRPWVDVPSMNAHMINLWNSVVSPNDVVYHLGDFAFRPGEDGTPIGDIFRALNGQINMVLGNHDYKNHVHESDHIPTNKVKWVGDLHYTKIGSRKQKAMLCHYPMQSWRSSNHGSWHLHGHIHGTSRITAPNRLNVSCSAWGYKPISEEEVERVLSSNISV